LRHWARRSGAGCAVACREAPVFARVPKCQVPSSPWHSSATGQVPTWHSGAKCQVNLALTACTPKGTVRHAAAKNCMARRKPTIRTGRTQRRNHYRWIPPREPDKHVHPTGENEPSVRASQASQSGRTKVCAPRVDRLPLASFASCSSHLVRAHRYYWDQSLPGFLGGELPITRTP
jgi:hypothetical protein